MISAHSEFRGSVFIDSANVVLAPLRVANPYVLRLHK